MSNISAEAGDSAIIDVSMAITAEYRRELVLKFYVLLSTRHCLQAHGSLERKEAFHDWPWNSYRDRCLGLDLEV
jgi:hypothetical protein